VHRFSYYRSHEWGIWILPVDGHMSSSIVIPALVSGVTLVALLVFILQRFKRQRDLIHRLRIEWSHPRTIERDLPAIAAFHEWMSAGKKGADILDKRTQEDLDLNSVFGFIDRTESAIGRQMLFHRLRSPALVRRDLEAFDLVTEKFRAGETLRLEAQVSLHALSSPDAYHLYSLLDYGRDKLPWWRVLFPLFTICMVGMICLGFIWPQAFLALLAGPVISLALRGFVSRRTAPLITPFRQLGPLIAVASRLLSLTGRDLESMYCGFAQRLPRLRLLQRIAWWASRDPTSQNDLEASLHEYLNMLFLLDGNALVFGFHELRRRTKDLEAVLTAVATVDAAISVASVRAGASVWTRPEFVSRGEPVELHSLYHPLLSAPVQNSVTLEAPQGLLINGANMTGKSTFIRSVGVNVVLAQSICTAFASTYKAPWLSVMTCIGRGDDLQSGKSYYQDEVQRVVRMIQAAAKEGPFLLLFDELFRGTNSVDRIAAGMGVLTYLVNRREYSSAEGFAAQPVILAATHDLELAALAQRKYKICHFEGVVTDEGLRFDYVLRPGPSTSRNAIALLDSLGAPAELVQEARASAKELESGSRGP
jgi:hypothetical protein